MVDSQIAFSTLSKHKRHIVATPSQINLVCLSQPSSNEYDDDRQLHKTIRQPLTVSDPQFSVNSGTSATSLGIEYAQQQSLNQEENNYNAFVVR